MHILKTINPEHVDENNIAGWRTRIAARAVVFDDHQRVGLLHVTTRQYYKLPGGGVEEGEDIETALQRECLEELGVTVRVIKELGSIVEYRAYETLKQTSICFLAQVDSMKGAPALTDEELSIGHDALWVDADAAVRLLNLHQTSDVEGKMIEERDLCFLTTALQQ